MGRSGMLSRVLAKKLRDIMRSYNVEKQRLSWELQVNVLQTQMKTIDEAFRASMITAGGAMLSGVLTIGVMGLGSGVAQRQSDQDKAIADLQQNGAQSYNKSLTDIMEKATEIMQQFLAGAALVIAIGDACCAYHNYQLICQQKEPLQTASDSVALVVSALALKCGASLNCANTLANCLSLLIRSGIAISMLVLPLQFPLPAAENIAASLDMGSVITSVSLTAIGAVLDYCLARPSGDDQENSVDELHADPSVLLAEQMAALCQSATTPVELPRCCNFIVIFGNLLVTLYRNGWISWAFIFQTAGVMAIGPNWIVFLTER